MNKKLYGLMNWRGIEEIVYSESDNPHELLGPHKSGRQTVVQAYFPGAEAASIVFEEEGGTVEMEMADEDGFFAAFVSGKESSLPAYHYQVRGRDGKEYTRGEAYRFAPQITRKDTEKFKNGIHYTVYEKLGAHPMVIDGISGTYFAVWAPNVMRASVVGDFNSWDGRAHQMRRLWDSGIFELFIPDVKPGDIYKFELKLKGGLTYLKADPYGNAAQKRPETASVVAELGSFRWEDEKFLKGRESFQTGNVPMSIYELYLGSIIRENKEAYPNYREIAAKLIPYIKEMGYTHVELMPVMEHPLDGSWGYQVIGYYAPTARYGSPEDFMYFVNELHKAGIGVILDWVPAHFPRDTYGLSNFDGTCLYEHLDPRQGSHPHWGTLIYNYGRPQVSNYLIANALFWVEKYHADGIRMDAVASMLYLDYGKKDGEWVANMYGGKENLEAIELIKHLNSIMKKRNPGVLTIAEESTAFPKITGELDDDGLGFDLKWNMGFMNDYLDYIKYDPYFRSHRHGELTFSMVYAYSEKFILVFSHDEVVHGKASLIGKMPGDRAQKFANLRLTFAYMMTHPGKKLLFMGQDLGEFDEWNEDRSVEWNLAEVPEHKGISVLMKDLNHLYRTLPALYEQDDVPEGFEWVNHISAQDCYLTYLRKGTKADEALLVVANFAGVEREITTGTPFAGKYKEIFNSDSAKYGGAGIVNNRVKRAKPVEWDDRPYSVTVKMAPLSLSILKFIPYTEAEIAKEKEERAAEERAKKAVKDAGKRGKAAARAEEDSLAEKRAGTDAEKAEKSVSAAAAATKADADTVKKTRKSKANAVRDAAGTDMASDTDKATAEALKDDKPVSEKTRTTKKTVTENRAEDKKAAAKDQAEDKNNAPKNRPKDKNSTAENQDENAAETPRQEKKTPARKKAGSGKKNGAA
ncbi:MAG: 1,4-alpha-glucan branching protein GlgB [Lachnospiraceae bacterium]|jgi:1,4-alpha-glucan branching enzyme|nr:1,4-alpha-glucan branching protein GlgB [Lachnospiraceae bacterium]